MCMRMTWVVDVVWRVCMCDGTLSLQTWCGWGMRVEAQGLMAGALCLADRFEPS